MSRIGFGYLGSKAMITSTANIEVIPPAPKHWNIKYHLYRFSFMNQQSCTVKINGGEPIFLDAKQGFDSCEIDAPIYSFIVIESGIDFNWVGGF